MQGQNRAPPSISPIHLLMTSNLLFNPLQCVCYECLSYTFCHQCFVMSFIKRVLDINIINYNDKIVLFNAFHDCRGRTMDSSMILYHKLGKHKWMLDNSPKNQLTQKPTHQSCDQFTKIVWSTHPNIWSTHPSFWTTKSFKTYETTFRNLFLVQICIWVYYEYLS